MTFIWEAVLITYCWTCVDIWCFKENFLKPDFLFTIRQNYWKIDWCMILKIQNSNTGLAWLNNAYFSVIMYMYMYTCTCTYTYMYMYMYVYMYMNMYIAKIFPIPTNLKTWISINCIDEKSNNGFVCLNNAHLPVLCTYIYLNLSAGCRYINFAVIEGYRVNIRWFTHDSSQHWYRKYYHGISGFFTNLFWYDITFNEKQLFQVSLHSSISRSLHLFEF